MRKRAQEGSARHCHPAARARSQGCNWGSLAPARLHLISTLKAEEREEARAGEPCLVPRPLAWLEHYRVLVRALSAHAPPKAREGVCLPHQVFSALQRLSPSPPPAPPAAEVPTSVWKRPWSQRGRPCQTWASKGQQPSQCSTDPRRRGVCCPHSADHASVASPGGPREGDGGW